MHTRRTQGLATAAVFAALVAAACSTPAATAPKSQDDGLQAFQLNAGGLAWPAYSFSYDPTKAQSFQLGMGHRLDVPANALCDVQKSSYGPGEWNKPCTLAKAPITIMVQPYLDADLNVRVEFSPQLRFSPAQQVLLTIKDAANAANPQSVILYCAAKSAACVNEGATDPDLVTNHDLLAGTVSRRIKHFSGYNVAARWQNQGGNEQ